MLYSQATIDFLLAALETLAFLFILAVGTGILVIITLYIIDVSQHANAIRRNYPVVGRFRYFFSALGEFFRQYFFAMDREELPFNRAQRTWCDRAANNANNTTAFGSTRNLSVPGTPLFMNCPYPTLEQDEAPPEPVTIGAGCEVPYTTSSLFNISGMSYGAISKPAVLALSNGARLAGVWMNTGEGGLSPHHLEGGADLVFQIGTAKYGVRNPDGGLNEDKLREVAAHDQVRMIEIKLSQGAKPGKGGILPAAKVTEEIAAIRAIPAGRDSLSPNRHPEINNAGELLDFIGKVRAVAKKPVGIKAVVGAYGWLAGFCELIHQRGLDSAPDFITVDGAEGGTGAAPQPLIDNMGLPLYESLPLLLDTLNKFDLRERIKVIASGKLVTPQDVAWAYCVGADFVTSARGFMFSLGCIQALKCNQNTCPTGITTHNIKLQKGLDVESKTTRVMHYAQNISHEVCMIAHSCGVSSPRRLKRYHVRVVGANGLSIPLDELHPEVAA